MNSTPDYGTPRNNMATLRIEAKPHLPVWMMVVQPFNFFAGYEVFAYVDDREYVLKSKKKVLEIPLFAGTHTVQLSPKKKSTGKLLQGAGNALKFAGALVGSGNTYLAGSVLNLTDQLMSGTGGEISLGAGETFTVKVKLNWRGALVQDE